jgi:hypothetical protein
MTKPELEKAIAREDPFALLQTGTQEELSQLSAAEDLLEKRHKRRARSSRIGIASQALVGYVAIAGFFANAYQNCNNSRQAEIRSAIDAARWEREFARAQQADRYRAFFETSALATDTVNADKRLVGYALLREFVDDKLYNAKAVLMLEESLAQELRRDTVTSGLDDEVRNLLVAILSALSHTSDCQSLEHAARSIDRLAKHRKAWNDPQAASDTFALFVRYLFGRAPQICPNLKELRAVRAPLRDTLMMAPELGGLHKRPTVHEANRQVAQILKNTCAGEVENDGSSDCADLLNRYLALCDAVRAKDPSAYREEADACDVIR